MTEFILFLTGIIVGVMNAVAGGGMLFGFPVMVALGIPPLTANATGHIVAMPGLITATWGYRSYLRRVPRRILLLIIPLCLGAAAGAITLRNTSAEHFAEFVPVLVLFGVALFTVQPLIHFHLRQHLRGRHKTIIPLILIAFAILPLAFYGGYFGAGFGFMMLAFLSFAHLHDTHVMNALKNAGSIVVAITTVIFLFSAGIIDWRIGLIMGAGTAIGGYIGARGSQRLSSHWLRIIVIVLGFSAVFYLARVQY